MATGAERGVAVSGVNPSVPSGAIGNSTAGFTAGVFVRDAENWIETAPVAAS